MADLTRFITAQNESYEIALAEIKNGKKQSHWMWYIFPQLIGLGQSSASTFYGIVNLQEARAYSDHPVLGPRLIEISNALLNLSETTAYAIFGSPDDKKLKSSMTLFSLVKNSNPVFKKVLQTFFKGECDVATLNLIEKKLKND
ncbi:calpastatin [Sphingobacteriaceae bacterium]|nr:calpastatin [Sphingobacteriaceae bacterium]